MIRIAVAAAIVGASILALLALGASGETWEGWTRASCGDHCFNEALGPPPIRQIANTWSNLGFVAAGALVLSGVLGAERGPFARPLARVVYGLLVASLGWTSMFFHASITLAGEWLDMFSMLLFASYVIAGNLRRTGMSLGTLGAGYVVANAGFAVVMCIEVRVSAAIFVGLALGILASDTFARRRTGLSSRLWLGLALLSCLASFAVWVLDRQGLLSSPTSLFQGHALWHVGQAVTTLCLFRHSIEVPS
ncbi:MAG TPA: ceramidase domain-containing protein [Planctomycetota bacterium]|nr:ceramidase domain-containing protein [Planctomycetota bacterium]